MISEKTHYQTLGVLENAEDIVIRAAYRVLAQKYHPDKWTGNRNDAAMRMSEINIAFETLSDPKKRATYDRKVKKNSYTNSLGLSEDISHWINKEWTKVQEYFPDMIEITNSLRRVSITLEQTYKLMILETKLYSNRRELAEGLQNRFLQKYFGSNLEIIQFAKICVKQGNQLAAKELNEVVSLLGSDVNPSLIISKLIDKHMPFLQSPGMRLAYEISVKSDASAIPLADCELFIKLIGGTFERIGIISLVFNVKVHERYHSSLDLLSLQELTRRCAETFVNSRVE